MVKQTTEEVVERAIRGAPRVISYTRFSSRRQAHGDSYRRQTEMAIKWCREHGHELDTSLVLEDLGVSGYSGANASRGALGVLQRMVLDRKLEPGTILLIEAFDRLTRLALPDAYEILLSLVNNGLTIVTVTDRKVWTKATMSSLEAFLMSLVTLYKGHQESSHKADRLQEVFEEARRTKNQAAFGSAPGWLYRETAPGQRSPGPWQVDEVKAGSVRKVFELAALGFGSKAIAKRANEEGWPVPTRLARTGTRWHGQMPGQLLRNRAVLGEHEHRIMTHEAREEHWKGRSSKVKHLDYYPAIIDEVLWKRARASISTRMVDKRRDAHYYNIFAGLMYCGNCGAPIHRKNEKTGYSRAQLHCSDKVAGASACGTMSAACADAPLLTAIFKYAPASISTKEGEELQTERIDLERRLAEKREEGARLARAIARGMDLDEIEDELEEVKQAIVNLDTERQALEVTEALVNLQEVGAVAVDEAVQYIYKPDDEEAREYRVQLHLKVSRLVETIWVWAYEVAMIKFKSEDRLHVVELLHKQLPSRANPSAKYHKQPPPKVAPEKPKLQAARSGALIVPQPRRSETSAKSSKRH